MQQQDLVHTDAYDYEELKAWAAEATKEKVKEFLDDSYP